MSLLADAVQPFLQPEFISIRGIPKFDALTDIIIAPKIGYDLSFNTSEKSISLDFRVGSPVVDGLAADCSRFASSAYQTIAAIDTEILNRDYVAWSFIKLYYAAFYAGHSILRLLGKSCSFLDKSHVRRIMALGATSGTPFPFTIEAGLYECELQKGTANLKCSKIRGNSGGVHEHFWDIFGTSIKDMNESIVLGPLVAQDAQKVYVQLESLRTLLTKNGAHKWLSFMRNELQYRHKFEVWFPANPKSREKERLSKLIKQWRSNPMDIELKQTLPELDQFISSCTFIISSCRILLERIESRSDAGRRCFITLGPTAFLRERSL